ncbi:SOS mutagenesis and repair protein UmuC [Chryseobacterium piscium]|uniref:SOS mutagenesis and repair protein UmuC n=1 Tax=Chryseobacterium piscium TaxID=333702 RepID=A0A3D9BNT8_9FLAO|nr:Y-family DNA polymerase [Chryseobacterium piscium]REC55170.1 SOS mutagenesis and repair protein UmuC [Chryseobacterium piscium]
MIALIDGNNFYASCERIFRYDCRDKPVVVLSNNDGCAIARSNEAKALGIKMGEPYFKVKHFEKSDGLFVFSANFVLYGDISNRVVQIVKRYCNDIEVYSIDESFLFLDGYSEPEKRMRELRNDVFKGLDLPTSIGIAPTKTLAKVANKIAKRYPEDLGSVFKIETKSQIEKALRWFPVEDIWGIGRQYEAKFKSLGVRRAWDLTQLPDNFLRENMGIYGVRMKKELLGDQQYGLTIQEPKKNIATTRTFDKGHAEHNYVWERVSTYASECARKLRKQNSCCIHVTVFITTDRYNMNQVQYSNSYTITLTNPSNSDIEISKAAKLALDKIFIDGPRYRKAGVVVGTFVPETERMTSLFDTDYYEKHKPLMEIMDKINSKYGKQKVSIGSRDIEEVWKMNRKHLSQLYINFAESIVLKA